MKSGLLILVFLISILSIDAQEPFQYTEAQIAVQDKYVEAKKFMLIGRFEKAQEILSNLYKDDRTNAAVSMELSKVYSYLEDPYNQHRYAQKAFESDPNNEYILANYAAICIEQEKFDESIPLLKSLVQKSPTNEEYTDQLATVYLHNNDSDSALKAYNNIESKIGITENISRRKFKIYELLGQDNAAIKELINISNAYPYEVRYMHNLASYYTKIGKDKKALETYNKILEVDINDVDANLAITTADLGKGNNNTYLRSLTPVIENKTVPVDRKILELVPYLDQLNQKQDPELADALVMLSDKIATIHDKDAKAHALKGDILIATNNVKGAVKAYEKTITLNDNVYSVWEGLLEAYTELGAVEKLKKTATEALDLFPNKPSAYMYYGRAYTMANEVDEAIDLLEEGVMVSGRDVTSKSNIYAELGRAYLTKKEYDKANKQIDKSLEISQDKNGMAYDVQGDIYFAQGDTTKAVKSWKKAISVGYISSRLQEKIDSK